MVVKRIVRTRPAPTLAGEAARCELATLRNITSHNLPVYQRHHGIAVAGTSNFVWAQGVVQGLHVSDIKGNGGGGNVLVEIGAALRTGDWHDGWSLMQQPGEGDLAGLYVFGVGNGAHHFRRGDIGGVVASLVAGIDAAVVVGGVLLGSPDCPGQKTPAQRGERNESDPEFL